MADVECGLPKVQQEPSEASRIVVENDGAENILSECVVSDEDEIEQLPQDDGECSWEKVSIYRIPHYLKNGDKKAYDPQIVSLGPYHHGEEHLRPMDQHKLRCLHHILKRYNHEIGLYVDSVKGVEQRARACYEGTISMSSDDFVHMLVLDGCFVIELFQGVAEGFEKLGYPDNDPVFSKGASMLKIQIQRDMIMLENQIPLFILDQLLSLQLGYPEKKLHVAELALEFFDPQPKIASRHASSVRTKMKIKKPSSSQCGLHCLEVLWRSFLPPRVKQKRTKGWLQDQPPLTPCVTKLREVGIRFSPRKTAPGRNSLGDIHFQGGILQIPFLKIHDGTRLLFLNLIAFEESHVDYSNNITSYVMFMHNLINSPEDVRYLCNCRIIRHCLGSDAEVADLFNRLCQDVAFDSQGSYLHLLSSAVTWHYARPWYDRCLARKQKWIAWRAILKNKYFDNPWSTISFIAAFVLLVLTFIQAFYAVYSYYRPRS